MKITSFTLVSNDDGWVIKPVYLRCDSEVYLYCRGHIDGYFLLFKSKKVAQDVLEILVNIYSVFDFNDTKYDLEIISGVSKLLLPIGILSDKKSDLISLNQCLHQSRLGGNTNLNTKTDTNLNSLEEFNNLEELLKSEPNHHF